MSQSFVDTVRELRQGQTLPPQAPITFLPVEALVASAANPRRCFNDSADAELVASIREHGILTPLLVRLIEHDEQDTYEIVAGHRRHAAALDLGLLTVPVTVRELSDDQARETAIVENLQREDLTPLDEAHAYQQLLSRSGVELTTIETVAATVGKSTAYVGRRLKLLALIPEVQEPLREGRISVAHAELLAKLNAADQALALGNAVWLPLQYQGQDNRDACTVAALQPLAELRHWIERRTALNVATLASDPESRALFPEAAAAIDELGPEDAPLEVALDDFGKPVNVPIGVLQPEKHFKLVTGKRCDHMERAIVVFGGRRGEVVDVCCAKKACKAHWPPKEKVGQGKGSTAPRRSWEEEEAERKARQALWDRVRPQAVQAVIAATKKVQSTPKTLRAILADRFDDDEIDLAVKAAGALSGLTFARVWQILNTIGHMYSPSHAQDALDEIVAKFDVDKAMKAAEAAAAAPAQNPNQKAIRKALDRVRATNAKRAKR